MYTKEYFIEKFKAIPDDKWTTGVFFKEGACCAYGHCGVRNQTITEARTLTPEAHALSQLIGEGEDEMFQQEENLRIGWEVVNINDGSGKLAPGNSPKERILNALNNLKD